MLPRDLVVTDLDGTLWHVEEAIHPATIAAFRELTSAGVPIVTATGRRLGSAQRGIARLGLVPPSVVLNGALGVDLKTHDRFHRHCFSLSDAVAVLAAFRSVGLDPCVYVEAPTHEVVVSSSPSTHQQHLDSLAGAVVQADLDDTVVTEPVLMFSLIGLPYRRLAAAAEKLRGRARVHLDRSLRIAGTAAITVAPVGTSKWTAVLAWCDSVGFSPTRVIAIGDGPNDVEILANADIALVPEGAHQAALDLADYVIPRPDDGGWAVVTRFM